MKKNKIIFGGLTFLLLMATACKKQESAPPQTAPVVSAPNSSANQKELESAKEMAFVTSFVSDVDLLIGLPADNELLGPFFSAMPAGTWTLQVVRDMMQNYVTVKYFNTRCNDGKVRTGSVSMTGGYDHVKNPGSTNVRDYADFGFSGYVEFNNFSVDDWKVDNFDATKPLTVINKVSSGSFNPLIENIRWKTEGKLIFTRPDGKTIIWDGSLEKELLNTADTTVFKKGIPYLPVQWNRAVLLYSATFSGVDADSAAYNCVVAPQKLLRDLNCSYQPTITGVSLPMPPKAYPFTYGKMTYTNSNFPVMDIDFGPSKACDNLGVVSFKGKSYQVQFRD